MNPYQNNVAENSGNGQMTPPDNMTTYVNVNWPERVVSAAVGTFLLVNGLSNVISKSPISNLVKAALGGFLLYRGATGNCPLYSSLGRTGENLQQGRAIEISTAVTVNKPRSEVYSFWRKLENLPRFMTHLKDVIELDSKRSHWEAKIPGRVATVKWNAEITGEERDSMISWRSIPGSTVENAGSVYFEDAADGNGTVINVTMSYRPPAGDLGAGLARLLNPALEKMVIDDIRNFKQYIETNEIPASQPQTMNM